MSVIWRSVGAGPAGTSTVGLLKVMRSSYAGPIGASHRPRPASFLGYGSDPPRLVSEGCRPPRGPRTTAAAAAPPGPPGSPKVHAHAAGNDQQPETPRT